MSRRTIGGLPTRSLAEEVVTSATDHAIGSGKLQAEIDEFVPDWIPEDFNTQLAKTLMKYEPEVARTIVGAVNLGWRIVTQVGSTAITIAPPEDKGPRQHFRPGRKVRIERVRKEITKHADPIKLAILLEDTSRSAEEILYGTKNLDADIEVHRAPEPRQPVPREIPRHVVEVKPMLAATKGGGYDSKIALERLWSDGTTDYKCVLCDYTSENRLSPRGHWQKHINAGEVEAVGQPSKEEIQKGIDVPNAAHYTPRGYRVTALAEYLQGLLDGGEIDPEELAKAALTWVHEQSSKGTRLSAEAEELTNDEIVQRIRMMIDGGRSARLEAEVASLRAAQEEHDQYRAEQQSLNSEAAAEILRLQTALAAQQQELMRVESERDGYKQRAARAAGDLQALRDLLNDRVGEDEAS